MKGRRTFRPYFRPLRSDQVITTDLPRAKTCPGVTHRFEAVIADRRNDSHAILSQITAQWMRFHNIVFKRSKGWVPPQTDTAQNSPEASFRERFRLTQAVVRARWHATIRVHVLPNLLSCEFRDKPQPEFTGMPDASARIALRSLHCLTRRNYIFAWQSDMRELKNVLNTGSHGKSDHLSDKSWQIFWPYFFQPGQYGTNGNATRYRPVIQPQLRIPTVDPKKHISTGCHISGADLRLDLLAGASASISQEADLLLPSDLRSNSRAATIARHLEVMIAEIESNHPARAKALSRHVGLISRKPPIFLLLLLEADTGPARGRHLGKFGSSLLAPWVSRHTRKS